MWLLTTLILTVPCIGLYVLKYRCIEAWGASNISTGGISAGPVLCLTPGTYGIPLPRHKPDVKACERRFIELCTLV